MKPPRIFIKARYYWLDYSQNGKRVRTSTGIVADSPEWKKSKHVSQLRLQLRETEMKRLADLMDIPFNRNPSDLDLPELLALYDETHEAERFKLSAATIDQYKHTINFLLRFEPQITTGSLTRDKVLKIRLKAKETLSDVTIKTYFGRLRTLFNFAVREGLRESNPFLGILVRVKPEAPRVIAVSDEYNVFKELYHGNIQAFAQIVFQRLTGFRVSEVCRLKWSQIDQTTGIINYLNPKGQNDLFPLTKAIAWILKFAEKEGEFVFHYRTRWSVSKELVAASKKHIPLSYTTHQLKKAYSQEVDISSINDRHFKQLMHHSPKSNDVSTIHYAGRNLRIMREILDEVQKHWIVFFKKL